MLGEYNLCILQEIIHITLFLILPKLYLIFVHYKALKDAPESRIIWLAFE